MTDTALSSLAGVARTADPSVARDPAAPSTPKQPINLRTSPAAQLVQALPLPPGLASSGSVGTRLDEVA